MVGFLLTTLAAISGGMILIALSKILDNQEELISSQASQMHHIEQKVQQIWEGHQPTYTCPGCGYRYRGKPKRCPNCYINLSK